MTPAASGRQYVLLRTLGEGSFGAVYLAQYVSTGGFRRKVAIKLLHPGWNPDSDAGRRLRDAARLLGRIHHPNIVRVDDLTQLEGRWAVVMEHVRGRDLEALVNHLGAHGTRIPTRTVLLIVLGVAQAMRAAWELHDDDGEPLRVVHRDIKPGNILVSELGEVKVLDFGIARATFEGREARTSEVRYGSIGYMSPERIIGDDESIAGDVYSLGVVAWELLVQTSLGRSSPAEDAHREQVDRAIAHLERECAPISPELVALIRSMLAWNLAERPELAQLVARLGELARGSEGPDLETWARDVLPKMPTLTEDALKGSVLSESNPKPLVPSGTIVVPSELEPEAPPPPRPATDPFTSPSEPAPSGWWLPVSVGLGALLVLGLGATAWHFGVHHPETDATPTAAATPSPPPTEPAPMAPEPVPVQPLAGEPAPPSAPPAAVPREPQPAPAGATAAEPRAPKPVEKAARPPEAAPASPTAAATEAATAPRLRSVKVALEGGSGLTLTCGDRSGTGSASVLLRDVQPGACDVRAGNASARFTVDQPRGLVCSLAGDSLTCR